MSGAVLKMSDLIHVNHSALFKDEDVLVPKHIMIPNLRRLYKKWVKELLFPKLQNT